MTLTSSQIINRLCLAIVCALWVRGSVSLGQPVEATDPLLLAPVEAEPISVGVGSRDLVNFEVETRIRDRFSQFRANRGVYRSRSRD